MYLKVNPVWVNSQDLILFKKYHDPPSTTMGQSSRKLTGYTTESVTFLIILEVLLTK